MGVRYRLLALHLTQLREKYGGAILIVPVAIMALAFAVLKAC